MWQHKGVKHDQECENHIFHTKAVRDEMNELLAQYRREKENAETR